MAARIDRPFDGVRTASPRRARPRPGDRDATQTVRLANSLAIEHSCGGMGTDATTSGLDRFEAAVVFAMEEAIRLRGPRRSLISLTRTSDR